MLEGQSSTIPMERRDDGFFEIFVERIGAGTLYRFELSDGMRVPDPPPAFSRRTCTGRARQSTMVPIAGAALAGPGVGRRRAL